MVPRTIRSPWSPVQLGGNRDAQNSEVTIVSRTVRGFMEPRTGRRRPCCQEQSEQDYGVQYSEEEETMEPSTVKIPWSPVQ